MLLDPSAHERLRRDGVAVAGALPPALVAAVATVVERSLPDEREGLHFSTASDDVGYRGALSRQLGELLVPALAPLLEPDARYLFGVAIHQRPGPGTGMGHHHDLSFVDDEDRSLVVWIPLVDVDAGSGTLSVLPGSHRDVDSPRGTPTFPSPFRELPHELFASRFVPVEVAAGTVVATDPRLAHHSTDNRAARDRVAVVLTFTSVDAPLVHHFRWPDGRVERFAVDAGFYTSFGLEAPPAAPSLGLVVPPFRAVGVEEFTARHPGLDPVAVR